MQAAPTPVLLSSTPIDLSPWLSALDSVSAAIGDIPALLSLAVEAGRTWPQPGGGRTVVLWELLASVAAIDVASHPKADSMKIMIEPVTGGGRVGGA